MVVRNWLDITDELKSYLISGIFECIKLPEIWEYFQKTDRAASWLHTLLMNFQMRRLATEILPHSGLTTLFESPKYFLVLARFMSYPSTAQLFTIQAQSNFFSRLLEFNEEIDWVIIDSMIRTNLEALLKYLAPQFGFELWKKNPRIFEILIEAASHEKRFQMLCLETNEVGTWEILSQSSSPNVWLSQTNKELFPSWKLYFK
jgi:hypothetical protein